MTASSPSVLIIGGGIGGLTTAIALRSLGIEARVLERSPTLGTVGAGITIQCNASAVYDALGVDFLPEDTVSIGRFEMISSRGKAVLEGDSDELGLPFASLNVHRAELQATLLRHLEARGGTLELGRQLVRVGEETGGAVAHFADGQAISADLIIGADGVHSTVRRSLFGDQPLRYSGQTCWRFAEPVTTTVPIITTERWSQGRRCGLVPLSRSRVYGYLVLSAPPDTATAETATIAHVQRIFGGMHPGMDEVLELLVAREAAGEPVGVHHGDLSEQPALSYGRGRVVLLGDAAHAMTPNMGQGAGMAIEDAAALALALCSGAATPETLVSHLEAERGARVRQIQKTSWQIGQMAHWQNPLVMWLRDLALGLMPTRMTVDQARATYVPGIELAGRLREAVQGPLP